MDKYAIIKDGLVVNLVEYETQPDTPPSGFEEGHFAIQSDVVGVGYTYKDGVFTEPQPFASWSLQGNKWVAPKQMPDDGKYYVWDEPNKDWVTI